MSTNNTPRNNIPLPSLAPATKVLFSTFLALGLLGFGWTWHSVLMEIYANSSYSLANFGIEIGYLQHSDRGAYWRLFSLHFISLLLCTTCAFALFRKTSLRRRVKALLLGVTLTLVLLDLAAWLYAPSCRSTNYLVGALGVLSGIPLIGLCLFPLVQMWGYSRWDSQGKTKRVVIVGGGFAGLYAALCLNKILGYHRDLQIFLLDKNNYFLFPPLLPSAAAGTIETRQVTYPFRRIFETTNIRFRKTTVTHIDTQARQITGDVEVPDKDDPLMMAVKPVSFPYDYLVLAPGSLTQTFDTPGVKDHAFFMRELQDAVLLRDHVIDCFERAAVTDSENQQKELLRFVVIGAGPTGIETATEIYDLIKFILLKRYPEIDPDIPEVHLVQSGERILPGWHESIVNTATKQLQQMKIKLMLGQRVTKITDKAVFLKSGEAIPTVSAIWCAGVKSHPLIAASRLPQDKSGRALVQEDLRVPGLDNVFVLGDASYSLDFKTQQPLPPLGQVAFQQGSHTGRNLVRLLRNEQTKPFKYFNFGALVSVGEHFAAVDLLGVRLSGFIGWIIWRSLYLAKIVGVSNKIRIVLDWTLDLLIERSITQIGDGRKAWPMANVKAISPGVQASSLPEDRSAKNDLRAGWKPALPEAFAD